MKVVKKTLKELVAELKPKEWVIDWSKVHTFEDMKRILMTLEPTYDKVDERVKEFLILKTEPNGKN